ncbi:hypothetical protein [Legionella cardiaca]|uniref:Ankyrin repeats (3 copies) n=1 Tax=Legionella cardiaca TaxID=1071983 RepID=A0ABY8AWS6_9GAMM|nr:hypothetical protein [Legionella cardiaca]WED44176.1 hypothetical protein PXX05_05145 [Legionella cardiaca]
MSEGARKQLIQEIKLLAQKTQLKKVDLILNKIEKKQYGKALLIACSHCKAGDKAMLRLVKLICLYQDKLSFNVNHSEGNMTAIGYAAQNANVELFMALEHAGAKRTTSLGRKTAIFVMTENLWKIKNKLALIYKKECVRDYEELNRLFSDKNKLPKRKEVATETLNTNYDLDRVNFIIKALNFLKTYQRAENRVKALPSNSKPSELAMIHIDQMEECRLLFEKICITIQNLSYELRGKYSLNFGPAPFTWMTFDQLGGLVIEPPLNEEPKIIPLGDISVSTIHSPHYFPAIKSIRFIMRELADRQDIIEEALKDFLNRDLDTLANFFQSVANEIQHPTTNAIKPISLLSIKAITSYITDLDNLIKLLNLVNYTGKFEPIKDRPHGDIIINPLYTSRAEQYKLRFNLSTKRGQHAALHYLEMIGELITGKNFSQFLCKLDNSIDWRAFIAIRDGIVHQDAGNNMHQIKQLMANLPLFEKIVGEDLEEFCARLINLLVLRQEKLGAYDGDPEQFWLRILKLDAEMKPDEDSEQAQDALATVERRTTLENEREFTQALLSKNAPQSIIEASQGILSGVRKIPDKRELGEIFSFLPSRQEDRARNKTLTGIMKNAIKKSSNTVSERKEKREQMQAARQKREMERKKQLKGLEHIREFAETLHKSADRDHLLNPGKRVMAAYNALVNIKEFLSEEKYLLSDLNFQTVEEWDKYHSDHLGLSLAKLLGSNPELNDAIEYNAAQFLQHLDTIRDYHGAGRCYRILENYSDLRRFRNYLEHGDPLYDNQKCEADNLYLQEDHRQQLTAPMFVKLVYEILPEFQIVVDAYTTDPHLTPLVAPDEMEEWTKVCTAGYKTNGFFSNPKSQEKEEVTLHRNSNPSECNYY